MEQCPGAPTVLWPTHCRAAPSAVCLGVSSATLWCSHYELEARQARPGQCRVVMYKAIISWACLPYLSKEAVRLADLTFYDKFSCKSPTPLCSQCPFPPRAHASCSSGLHRNLCPLASKCLTPDFLSLLRLLWVWSEGQSGLRPVAAFPLPGPGTFSHSIALSGSFFSPHAVTFITPHSMCKGHWRRPHSALTATEKNGCSSASWWGAWGKPVTPRWDRMGKDSSAPETSSWLLGVCEGQRMLWERHGGVWPCIQMNSHECGSRWLG